MAYFDQLKNVDNYIKMVEGYDGRSLVKILKNYLPAKSSVLELGMGPGKDLDLLAEIYEVTGSDASSVFLDKYRTNNPDADLLQLDAIDINTDRTFNCLYSNKVLHHLTTADLKHSFARQKQLLNKNGLLFHSFWFGEKEEFFDGLRFIYYKEDALLNLVGPGFEVVDINRYTEMEKNDSFYILLRRKG